MQKPQPRSPWFLVKTFYKDSKNLETNFTKFFIFFGTLAKGSFYSLLDSGTLFLVKFRLILLHVKRPRNCGQNCCFAHPNAQFTRARTDQKTCLGAFFANINNHFYFADFLRSVAPVKSPISDWSRSTNGWLISICWVICAWLIGDCWVMIRTKPMSHTQMSHIRNWVIHLLSSTNQRRAFNCTPYATKKSDLTVKYPPWN